MSDLKREYSPKEIKILDAATALLGNNSAAVGSLKVADIAAHAGIGKGTVYEYFSSKDEIFREAILRFVTIRIEEEWARAFSKPTFKECIYCAMEEMVSTDDGFCIWDLQLLWALDRAVTEEVFSRMRDFCLVRMREMCEQVLIRGVEEGLFPMPSMAKAGQAFVHLFGGLSLITKATAAEDQKEFLDRAYEMLIRTLQ